MALVILTMLTCLVACKDKRNPGRIYMPDMAYSRAYETNMPNILKDSGINYIPTPVPGTMRRGELAPYTISNDTTGYTLSAAIKSPIEALDSNSMLEAKRLYNINCAICHGANMDAQGPLALSGKVGGIANLKAGSLLTLSEGTMFHVVTYGKNNMGSYSAQLDRRQRWMVVQYVKSEQSKTAGGKTAGTDSTKVVAPSNTTVKDSAATVKK
ncbi:MAG: cytochrome c [Chitinophagaceae bacterium]